MRGALKGMTSKIYSAYCRYNRRDDNTQGPIDTEEWSEYSAYNIGKQTGRPRGVGTAVRKGEHSVDYFNNSAWIPQWGTNPRN